MSDSSKGGQPGVYVKNGVQRVATSPSKAVALVFDGYRLDDTIPAAEASYADLQAQAKELGIKANQSEVALREAIAAATPVAPGPLDVPVLDEDSPLGNDQGDVDPDAVND